ncbi:MULTISPECIES: N-acetyltransferase [Paenibacillus]|uniref:Acetyltransferase (GNAT) family protein n=1 Tax=Paenibacillus pabuli TaxID=1472 RepID=A0A855XYW3_9BACL|nr:MULTISPECIES: GNAT family N-acetyltransferase [Paenibacillus]PWW43493.1 acetyltransferase (GNAT) family protein [Paenibacillus pabuli]PXW09400.1 acetyltransferase (GNAT) family protein [Paenibacillus taichungensis]QLG38931.1 GNAT family N-acetyltransferase [Paenibacillus sp. E222]RAJ02949.1 acetyltransferase (GNAT) family protein [Paenibacillus pabuli]SEO83460.1 Acetyltransferase (GNAT) family protein [Paenibacillus sp. OK076]
MKIIHADETDYSYILERDRHIHPSLVETKIKENEILMIWEQESRIGWMRYGYFWDNIPFMNMIWIDEPYRSGGIGRAVVQHWEHLMKQKGFDTVMTSTQSDEHAQHFYRKLGYVDAGSLLLETQPLEIILIKKI